MSIAPKNWTSYQHYKNRQPAWIKLHHALLDDFAFSRLPVASRALAPWLWLLASEYERGEITASEEEIAFRLRMSAHDLLEALGPLIETGFFIRTSGDVDGKQAAGNPLADRKQDASDPLADRKQAASLEEEREIEEEKEKNAAPSARTIISETELYRRSKEILGARSGGLVKNLVKAKGGSIPLARAAVEIAATKHDPREYLGAIIRGRDAPDEAVMRGDAW